MERVSATQKRILKLQEDLDNCVERYVTNELSLQAFMQRSKTLRAEIHSLKQGTSKIETPAKKRRKVVKVEAVTDQQVPINFEDAPISSPDASVSLDLWDTCIEETVDGKAGTEKVEDQETLRQTNT